MREKIEEEEIRNRYEKIYGQINVAHYMCGRRSKQSDYEELEKENERLRKNASEVFIEEMVYRGGDFETTMRTGIGPVFSEFVKELMKSTGGENFASFRMSFNDNKHEEYYIIAGRENGDSIQMKYSKKCEKVEELEKCNKLLADVNLNNAEKISELERQNKGFQEQYNETGIEVNQLRNNLEIVINELNIVIKWKDAYPKDVFPPLTTEQYHGMCKASGISVDRVSAHVLRKIVIAYSEAAEKVLEKINKP